MPRITPGNRLYLYQLLSREIGTGRQTLLSKVEEVFAADDLLPEDLGCSSVQEVLEQLDGVVKLTVFKKGNTYATLLQNDELDRLLQQPDEPSPARKAASKGKPWKHRAKTKTVRPTKPRHRKVAAAPEPTPEPVPTEVEAELAPEPAGEPVSPPPADGPEAPQPVVEAEPERLPEPEPEPTPEPEAEDEEPAPEAVPEPKTAETAEAPVPSPAPAEPAPEGSAPSAPEPSIHFTVTYDPTQEEADAEAPKAAASPTTPQEPPQEPIVELVSPAEECAVTVEPLLVGLPEDFASEVRVPDGPLSLLYQLLPPDVNPMELLAQDWQVARSARAYEGTRSLVTFPLHLAHADGTPVRATLRRSARGAAGKHWALSAIDGRDGSEPGDGASVGLEGLPETSATVERLLARDIELGPWRDAFSALADVAAPERWDLPGRPGSYDVLRTYLAVTYRAVVSQGLLATSADGGRAAFATGLLSPLTEPVYACLEAGSHGFAWHLLGFSTAGEGILGEHLASLGTLPPAPRYLDSLADLALPGPATPDVPRRILRQLGEGAEDAVRAGLRRCAANYRLVAPAVDVQTGETCLLVPLATRDAATPDRALSLGRPSNGSDVPRATRLLGLAEAYVEARVVSGGMPAWLHM